MGRAGLEPATKCLKGACSTIELTTRLGEPQTISHGMAGASRSWGRRPTAPVAGSPPSKPQASSGSPLRQWPTICACRPGRAAAAFAFRVPAGAAPGGTLRRSGRSQRTRSSRAQDGRPGRRRRPDPHGRPQPPRPPRLRHPGDLRVRPGPPRQRGEVAARRAGDPGRRLRPGGGRRGLAARGPHPPLHPRRRLRGPRSRATAQAPAPPLARSTS